MPKSDVDIKLGATYTGKKAFKQAETATDKLGKSVKGLARNFGLAFGSAAVIAFGKASVKAFAEDEKAAASLAKTIENLGLGFGGAAKEVNEYISNLERTTGVLDDELRPAMDRMLRATSSITKSQKLLSLALDISAGTGKTLTQVSQSLQKAYLGQTQALGRLGVGLTKAELASGSMEQITDRLSTLFAGQATTAAEGLAGSMAKLTVATNNAKESLGKDMINAIGALSNGDGLPKTIQLIEGVSSAIGDAIIGISRLARNISIFAAGNPLESWRDFQKATEADRLADMKETQKYGGRYAELYKQQLATSVKINKVTTKTTASTIAATKSAKEKLALDKAQLALGKGESVFDMDAIQNNAALINQAEALGKATSSAQIIGIANDTARLNVQKSMLALQDAITNGSTAQIIAATAKLNQDLGILATLSGQEAKLKDIKAVLESLTSKKLIDIDNLNQALAILQAMALVPSNSGTTPKTVIPKVVIDKTDNPIFPPSIWGDGGGVLGGPRAHEDNWMSWTNGVNYNSNQRPDQNYDNRPNQTVTIKLDENSLGLAIQDTLIKLNRRGDSITTAGTL